MKIGLVRRNFSATGGAEAYLKRFAAALHEAGHSSVLFCTGDWPSGEGNFGERVILAGDSPGRFADALEAARPRERCDFLYSLERVWRCDAYRAGDGVHRAWLQRREREESWLATWFRQWRTDHREILALEKALFAEGGAGLVFANSKLVQAEITAHYGYPQERIRVVYNGVPPAADVATRTAWRTETRARLGFSEDDYLVLFAGSGWKRKGLRYAVQAIEAASSPVTLLVAGRGKNRECPASSRVRLLGPVRGLGEVLAAADVFLLPTLYDPFSNACLEAASYGLPVITTVDNGFAELLTPGVTGEVLPHASAVTAMVQAIDQWRDPARRATARPLLETLGRERTMARNLAETLAGFDQPRPVA